MADNYDLDLKQEYLDSNPASLSPELRATAAKAMGLSVDEVNRLIEEISQNYEELDPEEVEESETQTLSLWKQRQAQLSNDCHAPDSGKFCGDGGGGALPDKETKVLKRLDPEVADDVEHLLKSRREVEPEYTTLLSDAAAANGGTMIGLPFKFKEAEGIAGKIDRKVREKGVDPETAAKGIGDALRYTVGLPPDKYVSGMKATVKALRDKGIEFDSFENNWQKGDAYNGVNAVFVDKKTGLKIELQFHTDESFNVKDKLIHEDYEFVREHKGTSGQRLLALERMRQKSDAIVFPKGIENLGDDIHGVKVIHLFRPFQEELLAAAANILVNDWKTAEALTEQGVMTLGDWQDFVDAALGQGDIWSGYVLPNKETSSPNPKERKAELAARLEDFANPCHNPEDGKFCEVPGHPTPGRLNPAGASPRSKVLHITNRKNVAEPVEHALTQIGLVHGVPEDMRPLPEVKTNGAKGAPHGSYAYTLSYNSPLYISLKPADSANSSRPDLAHPALTFAHEFGHYIDSQMGGTPEGKSPKVTDDLSSQRNREDPHVKALFDAIKGSPSYQAMLEHGESNPRDRGRVAYFRTRHETFARAYSQWIAVRSKDPRMRDELDRVQNKHFDELTRLSQWNAREFIPIYKAFNDLFESRGLMRK